MVNTVVGVAGVLPGAVPAAAPHAVLVLVGLTTRSMAIVPNLLSLLRLPKTLPPLSPRLPPPSTEKLSTLMLKPRHGPPVRPLPGVATQLPSMVLPPLLSRLLPFRRLLRDQPRS